MSSTAARPLPDATTPAFWAVAAGLLVLMPNFSASPFASDYDSQRLLEVGAWVLLAGAVCGVPSVRAAWLATWAALPTWATTLMAGVLALGLASAAGAARPVYAFAEVASFVGMGVTAIAAAATGRDGARRGLALVAVAFLGGYAASVLPFHLADLTSDLASDPLDLWPYRHLGFGNVRHLNQIQLWTLPLVWALAASARPGRGRAGLRVVAAVTVALVIASRGRGPVLGLTVGAVVALLTVVGGRRAFLREAGLALGVGLVLKAVLFASATTVLDKMDAGANGRAELWAGAVRMIGAHPWLGVGPMHVAYYPSPNGAHPHNLALQLAAEWGLPAAALAALLALGGGVAWLRHARRAPDALWASGCTAALTGTLANAMVDGFAVAPTSQIMVALGLGALLAEALPAARASAAVPAAVPARVPARFAWVRPAVLASVVLPAAALLLAVCLSDAPRLGRRDYDFSGSLVSAYGLPRFWSTGQVAGRLPADYARIWPAAASPVQPRPADSAAAFARPTVSENGPEALTNAELPAIPRSHPAARPAFSATPNG